MPLCMEIDNLYSATATLGKEYQICAMYICSAGGRELNNHFSGQRNYSL